jgi:diaminopimelate decarboxylase
MPVGSRKPLHIKGFQEFFAVKALPNPYIMKILKEEGFGADCSSLPELLLAEKTGILGEYIMSVPTPLLRRVQKGERTWCY